jgi:8-oxo-dGTP diphosphatase
VCIGTRVKGLLGVRNIVNGVLVRHGTVLLARRSLHRKAYPGLWSFPGGHVEDNESLLEALARELREEIGIVPTTTASVGSIADPNSDPTDRIDYHMYAVTAWAGGEPKMIGDEHTELTWFTLRNAIALPDLALEGYRALFKTLADA